MHFKHPELLFALFLLIIPVIVHLFRLRRFKEEKFTNVRFLQKAVLQTRKSSRLKKWLVLFTRLFLLACIILAFAQPFFPPIAGEEAAQQQSVIYLDNSYSMQAKGKNGALLKRSIQDLLENLPLEGSLHFFTNDEEYRNISGAALQKKLQELTYSNTQNSWKTISLKAQKFLGDTTTARANFIALSDFQQKSKQDSVQALAGFNNHFVQLQPETRTNIHIDTVFISSKTPDELILTTRIKATGNPASQVSVGIYNDTQLLARKMLNLGESLQAETSFKLPASAIARGIIQIEDSGLLFDNKLFFSINENPPLKVAVIGEKETAFLQKIYAEPEFDLDISAENSIDFNSISEAGIIILNELDKIPSSLSPILQKRLSEAAIVAIIPSQNADISTYNDLFRELNLPLFGPRVDQQKLVSSISFNHPLYENVFEDRVENFQYPRVQSFYPPKNPAIAALKYESGQPFLYGAKNAYVFTAALNTENSDFKNSPLIVPSFYKLASLAVSAPQLYYVIGEPEAIVIPAELQKDEILKLSSKEMSFIPAQQIYPQKLVMQLSDLPMKAGHYSVEKGDEEIQVLSFNYDKSESNLIYTDLEKLDEIPLSNSLPGVFAEIKSATEGTDLWKWFVIFALFFLLTEMLILKFLK